MTFNGKLTANFQKYTDDDLDEEDVKALKGFGDLQKLFFARPTKDGEPFNVIVMREGVSQGEQVDGWRLEVDGKTLSAGKSIGIKRIRVLDNPVSGDCKIFALRGTQPVPVKAALYIVDPELVRIVYEATTESGETDTAKWMTGVQKHK